REHHAVAVGGEPLGGKQRDCDEAERDDAGEAAVDISLVDDAADQIGGQRGAGGGERHQRKSDGVARPMRQTLLGEQAPDQDESAVALVLGRRADRVLHPSSKWLETSALWRFPAAGAYGPFSLPVLGGLF